MKDDESEKTNVFSIEIEKGVPASPEQESFFLQTFPLIKKIATQKLSYFSYDSIEDITQKVALKLWKWKKKYPEKELSLVEWQKLANTATQNEIKTFYNEKSHKEILLSEIEEKTGDLSGYINERGKKVAGNSAVETRSLMIFLWDKIQKLSLRQKYAILFQQPEFIIDLISHKCCSINGLANDLSLTREELAEVIGSLPLSDEKISGILAKKTGEKITNKQVWEARGKAKIKLLHALREIR